jgi:hypothetical protein
VLRIVNAEGPSVESMRSWVGDQPPVSPVSRRLAFTTSGSRRIGSLPQPEERRQKHTGSITHWERQEDGVYEFQHPPVDD